MISSRCASIGKSPLGSSLSGSDFSDSTRRIDEVMPEESRSTACGASARREALSSSRAKRARSASRVNGSWERRKSRSEGIPTLSHAGQLHGYPRAAEIGVVDLHGATVYLDELAD